MSAHACTHAHNTECLIAPVCEFSGFCCSVGEAFTPHIVYVGTNIGSGMPQKRGGLTP